MATRPKSEPLPHIACEIMADRVVAARSSDKGLTVEVSSTRTLPVDTVTPSLTAENVKNRVALRQVVSDALGAVAGRSRDVIVLLPDAAARVVLLDFDALPERRQDAEPVVRFRLKKSLPFEVEKSAVSFEAFRAIGHVRVVAAVMLSSVLEEYEAAFRDTGYNPGVVLPATLASLGPVDAQAPTLVIKVDPGTTGVAIVENDELLLYRAIENAASGFIEPEGLAEEIYPSLVFFQDTYGRQVEHILVGGAVGVEQVGEALESHTGIRPQELVRAAQVDSTGGTPRSLLAGVVGALSA